MPGLKGSDFLKKPFWYPQESTLSSTRHQCHQYCWLPNGGMPGPVRSRQELHLPDSPAYGEGRLQWCFLKHGLWGTSEVWAVHNSKSRFNGGDHKEGTRASRSRRECRRKIAKIVYTLGNVYPSPEVSESVKAVIAGLPCKNRAGWQGLLLPGSLRHNSLFTGGIGTSRWLSGGSRAKPSALLPACFWVWDWPSILELNQGVPLPECSGKQLRGGTESWLGVCHWP